MTGVLVAVCAVAGLAVGVVINAAIRRVPDKEPVLRGGLTCSSCDAAVPWSGQVPVLSWTRARSRCPTCNERRPRREALVQVSTAVLFALGALKFEWSWALPAYLLFFAVLLTISVIDLDTFRIPNRIVYPMVLVSVPLLALVSLLEDDWSTMTDALVGGAGAFGFLLLVHLVYPAGMGFGDVKLAAVLGLYLGWLGIGIVPVGLFLGFLLGAFIGVALMATGIRGRKDPIPFGPFLAAGAVIAVLVGRPILDWYLPS